MRKLIYFTFVLSFLLVFIGGGLSCYAADTKYEFEVEKLGNLHNDRDIDTWSLHIFKKVSATQSDSRAYFRGITLTRATGDILLKGKKKDSSAFGIGHTWMLRYQKHFSSKFSGAVDVSGGLIIYDERFPAGGEHYNFMWRIGPKFIYKFSESSSVNIGYMWMHVSNGLSGEDHNPSYDARGVSIGFDVKF